MDTMDETRAALLSLVSEQQKRELPAADWVMPLQDMMNSGSLFDDVAKYFPYPLVVFRNNGVLEMANDRFLKEVGAADDDIKSGELNIFEDCSALTEAVTLSLKMQTNVVNGLKNPLNGFAADSVDGVKPGEYKTAIVFPIWDESPILRGAALFLPMEF